MRYRKGITLIELIISFAILGIISVTILNIFSTSLINIKRARITTESTHLVSNEIDMEIDDYIASTGLEVDVDVKITEGVERKIHGKLIKHNNIDEFGKDLEIITFVPKY